MSAATEDLLSQIISIESLIKEKSQQGQDVSQLKEQLIVLREQFNLLSENLGGNQKVLKG